MSGSGPAELGSRGPIAIETGIMRRMREIGGGPEGNRRELKWMKWNWSGSQKGQERHAERAERRRVLGTNSCALLGINIVQDTATICAFLLEDGAINTNTHCVHKFCAWFGSVRR